MRSVLGWDIGGVNTKAALVVDGELREVRTRAFELQRTPGSLVALLRGMAAECQAATGRSDDARTAPVHAVTMTAELSQMFRTKREGVAFVLDAVEAAFAGAQILVYTTDGRFVSAAAARDQPRAVAAANWVATATVVAHDHADALLVDVGSTTCDLVPVAAGRVAAAGRTDLERLSSGELVYTGLVRTPIEAIVTEVPVPGGHARVSAEGFALSGDAHLWLGTLASGDYQAATPDGRPPTRTFAGERLARVVCADREMLDDAAITTIARAVADAQVERIAAALREVCSRHPALTIAVVTGLGAALGARAAECAGLNVVPLSDRLGAAGARSAPATAVALLLDGQLAHDAGRGGSGAAPRPRPQAATGGMASAQHDMRARPSAAPRPDSAVAVVKFGGGLLDEPDEWRTAISALAAAGAATRVVVVPGGGWFANAVRHADASFGLDDHAAHWMAIAGMDQHAEMLAAAHPALVRVLTAGQIAEAHTRGVVPVLAPLDWLRRDDPLPHSWDVTSDSIAAWFAGQLDATRLLLVKPRGAAGPASVDPYFPRALPAGLPWATCDALELAARLQAPELSAG